MPADRARTKERANSRGDATRLLLLMTAEQLFAERGIAAVPLRDIGAAAGQKNNGVVQYYFGDRDSLVRDIIAYRAEISEKLRVEMLADILAGGLPAVADLVTVFVLPMAVYMEEGNHYIALLSRYIIEHGGYGGLDRTMIPSSSVYTLRGLLGRLVPGIPGDVLDERWLVMMTSAIHTLARYQTVMTSGGTLSAPIGDLLDDLVRFLTAGIEAPVGESSGEGAAPSARPSATAPGRAGRGRASGAGRTRTAARGK
jgi:AcrR family transcriptional regulator